MIFAKGVSHFLQLNPFSKGFQGWIHGCCIGEAVQLKFYYNLLLLIQIK